MKKSLKFKGTWAGLWSSSCLDSKGIPTCSHRSLKEHIYILGSISHNTSNTDLSVQPWHTSPRTSHHSSLFIFSHTKTNHHLPHILYYDPPKTEINMWNACMGEEKRTLLGGAGEGAAAGEAKESWINDELKTRETNSKVAIIDFISSSSCLWG